MKITKEELLNFKKELSYLNVMIGHYNYRMGYLEGERERIELKEIQVFQEERRDFIIEKIIELIDVE